MNVLVINCHKLQNIRTVFEYFPTKSTRLVLNVACAADISTVVTDIIELWAIDFRVSICKTIFDVISKIYLSVIVVFNMVTRG